MGRKFALFPALALALLSGALTSFITGSGQAADAFPSRPIKILVGYNAGGTADVVTRLLAQEMQEQLGQPVLIENRPGGAGVLSMSVARDAPADGYTMVMVGSEAQMLPYLLKKPAGFTPEDFTQVASFARNWFVFASNPKVPAKTLAEFIAYAKANPGKLRFGASPGGILHMSFEIFKAQAGLDIEFVPYKGGGAQTLTATISGEIEAAPLGLSNAKGATGGGLNILVQTGGERHALVPDVPTIREAGFPNAEVYSRFALAGPPNIPADVMARLTAAIEASTKAPRFKQKLFDVGMAPQFEAGAALKKTIDAESVTFKKLQADLKLPQID